MVCHALYLLDASSILLRELLIDGTKLGEQLMRERLQLGLRQFAQGNEILDLYPHTIADKGKL